MHQYGTLDLERPGQIDISAMPWAPQITFFVSVSLFFMSVRCINILDNSTLTYYTKLKISRFIFFRNISCRGRWLAS